MHRLSEQAQRVLLLIKNDSKRLYERVQLRAPEYMLVFNQKRTREHFRAVYNHRYDSTNIAELKLLSQELIIALDRFYTKIDEVRWYLYYTEDMPTTVEDKLYHSLAQLEKLYFSLEMYIDAEMSQEEESVVDEEGGLPPQLDNE